MSTIMTMHKKLPFFLYKTKINITGQENEGFTRFASTARILPSNMSQCQSTDSHKQ